MRFPSRNKYHTKPKWVDGIYFRSTKEARRYQELCLLQKAGEITHLKCQVPFPLWISEELCGRYVADFTYRNKNGEDVVEDVKGMKKGPVYELFRLKKNILWATKKIMVREI